MTLTVGSLFSGAGDFDRSFTEDVPVTSVFSFGGGVQSHAVLALAAQGVVQYDAFVFANVGNDSENPDTLTYIEQYTKPYCVDHGINFVEVSRSRRAGMPTTLKADAIRPETKSVVIPAYVEGEGQTNRGCTTDWKIAVVDRWIKQQKIGHVIVGLGISTDEWQRVRGTDWSDGMVSAGGNKKQFGFWKKREYPLMLLNISRSQCQRIISESGLPTPPKSSCYFCPFKRRTEWIELRQTRPDLFEEAVNIEDALNSKGLPRTYRLHQSRKPLREAVADQSLMFPPEDDICESGYCWT